MLPLPRVRVVGLLVIVAGTLACSSQPSGGAPNVADAAEPMEHDAGMPDAATTMVTLIGAVTLPAPPTGMIEVYAETWGGVALGTTMATGDGAYEMTVFPLADEQAVVLRAVDSADPANEGFGLVDLTRIGSSAAARELPGLAGGKGIGRPPHIAPIVTLIAMTGLSALLSYAAAKGTDASTAASSALREWTGKVREYCYELLRDLATAAAKDYDDHYKDSANKPPLIKELGQLATTGGGLLDTLSRMQQRISSSVASDNRQKDPSIAVQATRKVLAGATGESNATISSAPIAANTWLALMATLIAGAKTANCREMAYLAAYAASLLPDLKSIAIIPLASASGNGHAVTVACTAEDVDFDKVVMLSDVLVAPESCFIIDPFRQRTSARVAAFSGEHLTIPPHSFKLIARDQAHAQSSNPPISTDVCGRCMGDTCKDDPAASCAKNELVDLWLCPDGMSTSSCPGVGAWTCDCSIFPMWCGKVDIKFTVVAWTGDGVKNPKGAVYLWEGLSDNIKFTIDGKDRFFYSDTVPNGLGPGEAMAEVDFGDKTVAGGCNPPVAQHTSVHFHLIVFYGDTGLEQDTWFDGISCHGVCAAGTM